MFPAKIVQIVTPHSEGNLYSLETVRHLPDEQDHAAVNVPELVEKRLRINSDQLSITTAS